jgi:hypothetical protein
LKSRSNKSKVFLLMLSFGLFCSGQIWAIGDMKGNLDKSERAFFNQTLIPILTKSKVCISATGDCLSGNFFICSSYKTLSCDTYGISDEKTIKEILVAVVNSGLKISRFSFWRSKYHETGAFEKPLIEYVDRTVGK